MNNKIIVSVLSVLLSINAGWATTLQPQTDKDFGMLMMTDGPRPDAGAIFMPGAPMFGNLYNITPPAPHHLRNRLNLTDDQMDKFRKLDLTHNDSMGELRKARAELRDRYQEKFEAVLTDEQFRKVEKMRKDLRHEMEKLNEKERKIMNQHREQFESILTTEQKRELSKIHSGKTKTD